MEYNIGDRNGCIEIVEHLLQQNGVILLKAKCDCGHIFQIQKGNFKKSLGKFCTKCRSQGQTFHTKETRRIRGILHGMKTRCFDSNFKYFHRYGGRGIGLCKEWLSFPNFYKWAISNGYQNNLTIDRIDVDGNYEPSNCRWATMKEQHRNRTNNVLYKIDEQLILQTDIRGKYGIPRSTIFSRMKKGLSIEEAINISRYGRAKKTTS
jgi:hypothetical protein